VGDLTFALNYRLGGLSVTGYHLVNVAIHAATALLVAGLAAVTLRTPAARAGRVGPLVGRFLPLAAGLLFAVHPLATQAVTYVVQRYASLATLLYVLALVLYARARLAHLAAGRATARVVALGGGALLAAAAAMTTKEISVTLPLAAAGYDLAFFRGGRRWPLLAPLAALPALPLLDPALAGHLDSEAPLPAGPYALTQTRVVVAYLRLLAWPSGQNVDHHVALSTSLAEPAVLGSLALLVALAAAAGALLVRGRRAGRVEWLLLGGGIAWFFLTLSVESSVLPLKDVMFEHRAYLPSVGALLAAATLLLMGVERLPLPGPAGLRAAAALALVAVPLGVATFQRNAVWRDDVTLWADAVAKSPGKARPRQFLGTALAERGELDAAVAELLRALELQPGYKEALFNLGNVYATKGQLSQAMVAFTLAAQADPGHAMTHNNLGAVFHRLGNRERAAAAYQEALRLDPGLQMARRNLELLGATPP
jgi:tetratricopeptide (TPR) repeat protein